MTEWASLQHAYGTAEDVPDLLGAAEESSAEHGPAWDELWSRLCHQETVYTASYAALPLLADIAGRHEPAGYVAALDLAAAIVASTDGPTDPAALRAEHAETVARLRDLAERNIPHAATDAELVYGLQALMAFEDGGVWQRQLSHVADGELPVVCPHCRTFLLLDLDGGELVPADGPDQGTPVHPAEPADGSVGARLMALCQQAGRPGVEARLRYALGSVTCPACRTTFAVPDALA
ncbi:hypothetical protein [Nocardioides sp. zg-1230]|uniref:hypothetical protein n=1 Tax=Nocardioides sp. zg-1230 TaxID=2736601 RepID=UPI00155407DF|nr:hypothetical protein [Nocardioides sp. zg-1230]NPC43761.1 hypothetical protein [Nocardioides sp. zg-1230]